jgi:DNA adenine methylase/adenine-specific DNA-methyltransferase
MHTPSRRPAAARPLFDGAFDPAPVERALRYPRLRFMGSKHRLLPWIASVLEDLKFETALDAFSGSGCVAYLLKALGKEVHTNDFLNFSCQVANALVANSSARLSDEDVESLLRRNPRATHFIETMFRGVFFTDDDNRFLDDVWANLREFAGGRKRSLVLAALFRACLKRQPRGVFTIAGPLDKYDDGRRDLKLSLKEHFLEAVALHNSVVFANGRVCRAFCGDVFATDAAPYDLVYLDPPYVPKADDNCYIKRYHFLEGLSCYWEGQRILTGTKVKKIEKRFTPFSYRRTSIDAFDRLFAHFRRSAIVLSYSSNGFPSKEALLRLLERHKRSVEVFERPHRYHFGTHDAVRSERASVTEYLFVGK